MSMVEIAVRLVRCLRRVAFRLRALGASVSVGRAFVVGPRVRVVRGSRLAFGDRVNIGAEVTIQTDVEIGDDVMISSRVGFIGNDHDFSDPTLTIQQQGRLPRTKIVIEGDNLIGFDVIILGSVTIGRGAIVGAGSLVTRDIPADSVCAGRPARVIRARRGAAL